MNRLLWFTFAFSVAFNFAFVGFYWLNPRPNDQLGVLKEDVHLELEENKYFTVPKGIVVRNSSPRGLALAGQFEPERFVIQISSNRQLVDYQRKINDSYRMHSADQLFDYESNQYNFPD